MDVFHRDNQITQDKYIAAYTVYLGYELIRVQVHPDGTADFTLRVPQFDWDIVLEEAANSETAVCFKPLVEKIGWVIGKWSAARKTGCWQKIGG